MNVSLTWCGHGCDTGCHIDGDVHVNKIWKCKKLRWIELSGQWLPRKCWQTFRWAFQTGTEWKATVRMTHSPTQAALLAREESKAAQLITLYFSVQHTAASLHLASNRDTPMAHVVMAQDQPDPTFISRCCVLRLCLLGYHSHDHTTDRTMSSDSNNSNALLASTHYTLQVQENYIHTHTHIIMLYNTLAYMTKYRDAAMGLTLVSTALLKAQCWHSWCIRDHDLTKFVLCIAFISMPH